MLSILIPTYNFNTFPLVKEIHFQVSELNIVFEVLVYDDASNNTFDSVNESITSLSRCQFKKLKTNIGRSAIRNLLAKNAHYESLLFIDAGTIPKNKNFITQYIKLIDKTVATGGMTHQIKPPGKPYKLRWLYTKYREQSFFQDQQENRLFHSSNFLVQQQVFKKFPFDETLKGYGYEDVLFCDRLMKNDINIHFFNNPVIHLADDTATEFIIKTENSLENLRALNENNILDKNTSKISRAYLKLVSYKLLTVTIWGFKLFKPLLLLNLKSSYPSLKLFDIYRLGYFCSIKTKD